MKTVIAAIVPMRHESERVPGKNFRFFGGRPLYRHIVDALGKCPLISEILIDTDSPLILKDARENFPAVRLVERPAHLRGGMVPMNEILLHDVTCVEADFYLQTHSTNPLLRTETITRAIETFLRKLPEYDSLFSVTKVQTRFWDRDGHPVNHNPDVLVRTQDLPPLFEENSNIYIFDKKNLRERKNRIGKRPLMFEMEKIEAIDIDEEIDFTMAEILYEKYRKAVKAE